MTDCQRTAWTLGGGMQVKRLCLSSFSQNAMNVRNSRSGSRDHFWMIYYFSFFLLQSQFFRYFIRGNGLGVSHCKKMFQKGVQLWQAEKPQIVFFFLCDEEGVCYKGRGCYGDAFPDRRSKSTIFCSSCRLQRFSSFFISWPLKAAQEDEAVTFTIF